MPLILGYQTVTLVRRVVTGQDAHGEDIHTVVDESLTGCSFQPVSSVEQLGSGDQIVTRWQLFAPGEPDMTVIDAVIGPDGLAYEVDGQPQTWPDVMGRVSHTECYLRRAVG